MDVTAAILLTLTLVMPAETPDVDVRRFKPSLDECVAAGTLWLKNDARAAGGIGLRFSCEMCAERT